MLDLQRRIVRPLTFICLSVLLSPTTGTAQQSSKESIVFRGTPISAIEEFGFERVVGAVKSSAKAGSEVVISEVGGKFYWKSRENRPLVKVLGGEPHGAIVTYIATDGAGYIRIMPPTWKASLQTKMPHYQYDYMEHMLQGLGSFTYFGETKK